MTERPILFSAPMVRAILAGRKTQTRRLVAPRPPALATTVDWNEPEAAYVPWQQTGRSGWTRIGDPIRGRYGVPGDRLWVREAWAIDAPLDQVRREREDAMGGVGHGPYYRATEVSPDTLRWRPSIHMPRWASRITLEVTGVRVERLQAISEKDAEAEGVELEIPGLRYEDHRIAFAVLWDAINGKRAPWSSNPWVWVVEFRRLP